MRDTAPETTGCDVQPIHIPGAIQPHGMLLVLDRETLTVTHVAGDVEGRLGVDAPVGRTAADLITDALALRVARMSDSAAVGAGAFIGQLAARGAEDMLDVSAHRVGNQVLVEIEPGPSIAAPASSVLSTLDAAATAFERTSTLKALCERAALEFRRLTGFDRVLVYRFMGESGAVLAEDRADGLPSFLNHHFPGSDVPQQARALYVRNLVRVIPDVGYAPALLRPAWKAEEEPLDMSDSALRSVAPVHVQYLHNMGVAASASVSIVRDGALWGLIACHNTTPRLMPLDVRVACRALAGGLARQIGAKQEAATYRERIRVRSFEDEFAFGLARAATIDQSLDASLAELQQMVGADGVAVVHSDWVNRRGECPNADDVRTIAGWVADQAVVEPFASERLGEVWSEAARWSAMASGLLAVTVAADEPFVLMWFRAEHVQVINWAGNPHKSASDAPGAPLNPRASFEAWSETVRGRARPWTPAETEGAGRVRRVLLEARQTRRLRELNERLSETVADKEALLQQKEFLLREVNHRVQNSLQLVSSFLALQARSLDDPTAKAHLQEAQRRLSAVALVHRRLYRADQVETIDLSRYIEELTDEMLSSMGAEWRDRVELDIAPVSISADRAVTLGLVFTELVINANKYAYGGGAGPVHVCLDQEGANLRLSVADHGRGKHQPGQGFGTRMMAAMVGQLEGRIDYRDNDPGLRAVLTAPLVVD